MGTKNSVAIKIDKQYFSKQYKWKEPDKVWPFGFTNGKLAPDRLKDI